jgi:hypothetical protein
MNIVMRIPKKLMEEIRQDLMRSHAFAAERVGFISCHKAILPDGILVLADGYYPVAENDYLQNQRVGAMIGADAIRKAMQKAYSEQCGMFHVHMHHHRGRPSFSSIDRKCNNTLIPDFFNASHNMPHGAVVLSLDGAHGQCWSSKNNASTIIKEISVIGVPTTFSGGLYA